MTLTKHFKKRYFERFGDFASPANLDACDWRLLGESSHDRLVYRLSPSKGKPFLIIADSRSDRLITALYGHYPIYLKHGGIE